jgi:hypothetical protein
MSAWVDSKNARHAISEWGYGTPIACERFRSPAASLISGASAMLMPFESPLPKSFRWPASVADRIAIRSDWSLYGMDYRFVCDKKLLPVDSGQQVLFDLDRASH